MMLRQLTAPSQSVQLGECTKAYMTLDASDKSPTSNGTGGNSTLSGGAFATGPLGGPEYTGSAVYKTGTYGDGRHSLGANWLAFDGHTKWLMGTQVSPGSTYWTGVAGLAPPSNWVENYGNLGNAAGTNSMTDPTGQSRFAMTFSGV
jgi:prepilin-type processing-associated H-X9-DG protein